MGAVEAGSCSVVELMCVCVCVLKLVVEESVGRAVVQ